MAAARPPGRLNVWLFAGLSAVFVMLLVASGVFGMKLREASEDEARREAVLHAARQEAVNFTTVSYKDIDTHVKRVLEGATGDLKSQYKAGVEDLRQLVTQNEAVSEGEVLSAGIVSMDDDSARVLVVADSQATNASIPEGQTRHLRMQLELTRADDRWLVSQLQFVG
ncbi:MAG: hypothetical protein ACRDPK_08500 [Carbonactinosporaceae bacterium]